LKTCEIGTVILFHLLASSWWSIL